MKDIRLRTNLDQNATLETWGSRELESRPKTPTYSSLALKSAGRLKWVGYKSLQSGRHKWVADLSEFLLGFLLMKMWSEIIDFFWAEIKDFLAETKDF